MLINNTGAAEVHWQSSHRIPAREMRVVGEKDAEKWQRWNLLINAALLKHKIIINVNLIIAPH